MRERKRLNEEWRDKERTIRKLRKRWTEDAERKREGERERERDKLFLLLMLTVTSFVNYC